MIPTIKVVWNRKNKLTKKGDAAVTLDVHFRGRRHVYSTGVRVKPEQWDPDRRQVIGKGAEAYNMIIRRMIHQIETFALNEQAAGRPVTIEKISAHMGLKVARANFLTFMQDEIEKRNDISDQTRLHHRATLAHLTKHGVIETVQDLTYANIADFDKYLRDNMQNNTVVNHHKRLRMYIDRACRKKQMRRDDNPYNEFRFASKPTVKHSLTMEEVEKIRKKKLTDDMDYVRNLFILACYTGLSFEDMMALTDRNIETTGGKVYIRYRRKKTGTDVLLPVSVLFNGAALEYIRTDIEGPLLPSISNQHVNRCLKAITPECGVKWPVTFHAGRHTFGTLLAEITGDPYLIKSLMGHKDIRTSMTYIHDSRRSLEDKLEKVKW